MTQLPYITAVVLGSLHAFEADHLAAVTSFVMKQPREDAQMQRGGAVHFGMLWALGHGGAVLIAGLCFLLLGVVIPQSVSGVLERLVGTALIVLGVSTAWLTHRAHTHAHARSRAPAAMGLIHGLAGAAPAVALIPLAASQSIASGISYLLLFALGTLAAMSSYAALVGIALRGSKQIDHRLPRVLGRTTGLGTIVIGVMWLIH